MNHNPLAFICNVKLNLPSNSDKTADADRLENELKKMGFFDVNIPLNILRKISVELRKNRFEIKLVLGIHGKGMKVLDVSKENIYGLAVDIGSSNIECSLFDLAFGKKIDSIEVDNPQLRFGSDVLTRVQHSIMGGHDALVNELLAGINATIKTVCAKNRVSQEDIFAVTVAGNTIMTHFFLGIDVNNIPVSPYIPAVNRAVFTSAEETGLAINKHAIVYVLPNSGSYVGGDIISGIMFSGIYKEKEPVLFIDVGTNVEITLGCADWIMVGAGAAGPALEGDVADIGKKAEKGTICRVRIDRITKKMGMDVIAGIEPTGICGSGMIDLVSELFLTNIIDQSGKFTGIGIIEKNSEKAYVLYKTDKKELLLTEKEIQNFLLSKAAMFSFLYVFVKAVGLTFSDIKKVYIAGALGCGINLENAVNIGLLPDLPKKMFIPLGNSSLGGAEMILLNRNLLNEIDAVLPKITYREMNEDNELMNMLQGAMFIPHTEPEILKG